jgi:hypothetical protein
LNAFEKWITNDKKFTWGDNLNRMTKMEDRYHTFTQQMEEPEELPNMIDATKDLTMETCFTNNLNRLCSLVKKKKK